MRHIVQQIAAHGRNGDTELVHMTPAEVRSLRTLAKAAGTEITTNPHTGLPEAFNFKSLLPTIAGLVATPFIGPMGAMAAGAALGAATNKDDRLMGAISGGLGGYGGSSVASGLMGLGTQGAASEAAQLAMNAPVSDIAASAGTEAVKALPTTPLGIGASENPSLYSTAASNAVGPPQGAFTAYERAYQNAAGAAATPPPMSGWDSMRAGASQAWDNPSALKNSSMTMMNTAAPIYGSLAMAPMGTAEQAPSGDNGNAYEGEVYWDRGMAMPGALGGFQRTRARKLAGGGLTTLREPGWGRAYEAQGPVVGGGLPPSALRNLLSNPNFQAPRPLPPQANPPYVPLQPGLNEYLARYQQQSQAIQAPPRVDQGPALGALKPPALTALPVYDSWWMAPNNEGGGMGEGGGSAADTSGGNSGYDSGNYGGGDRGGSDDGGDQGANLAGGGLASVGQYLRGPGDGMSDDISAEVGPGGRGIRVAANEYVVPADVVSHLGNGSSDAGAKVLDQMGARVRAARTGNPKQGKRINPAKVLPA
jgi:hypothetical protein